MPLWPMERENPKRKAQIIDFLTCLSWEWRNFCPHYDTLKYLKLSLLHSYYLLYFHFTPPIVTLLDSITK